MTCMVIFITLLIERFFDWSHLRTWIWFSYYQRFIKEHAFNVNPYLLLMMICLPIVVLILVLQLLLDDWLYGFAKMLFDICILLYAYGPKNLWADTFFSETTVAVPDVRKSTLKTMDTSYNKSLHWYLLNNIFIAANVRIFAVIFWFIILGPGGAILYRLVNLLSPGSTIASSDYALANAARHAQALLDWVPIRIFTFLFALSGHFVQVLETWRKYVSFGLTNNETMLTECGIAALGFQEQNKIPEDGSAEKNAENLIDRVFIFLIVLSLLGIFIC